MRFGACALAGAAAGVACLVARNQSYLATELVSAVPVVVRAPPHTFILNSLEANHPHYKITRGILVKPVRKMHEYEIHAELGIEVVAEDGTRILDVVGYPDFPSFYLGISCFPVFLTVLLKLFG